MTFFTRSSVDPAPRLTSYLPLYSNPKTGSTLQLKQSTHWWKYCLTVRHFLQFYCQITFISANSIISTHPPSSLRKYHTNHNGRLHSQFLKASSASPPLLPTRSKYSRLPSQQMVRTHPIGHIRWWMGGHLGRYPRFGPETQSNSAFAGKSNHTVVCSEYVQAHKNPCACEE